MQNYSIILASNSPRRKELLSGLGFHYEVRTLPGIDESYPEDLKGGDIPLYISRQKANAYREILQPNELIITADTIVWLHEEVLGKPHNREEAISMLQKLSGQTHEVFTGVTLTTTQKQHSFYAETKVTFALLSNEEIAYYVDNYKPYDNAGAYAIQEWIGHIGITGIEGSYFNVVGFPVQRVYEALRRFI